MLDVDKIFRKTQIKAFRFKDFSWIDYYKSGQGVRFVKDIDILADYKDWKQIDSCLKSEGWRLTDKYEKFIRAKNYHYKYRTYAREGTNKVKIDLQSSPTILWGNYSRFSPILERFQNLLMSSYTKQNGLLIPEKYHQVLANLLHCYFHDKCIGLRQLFELKEIFLSFNKTDWVNMMKLCHKFGIMNIFWFVVLNIEKLYSEKLIPDQIKTKINKISVILSEIFPIYEIQLPSNTSRKIRLLTYLTELFLSVSR